MTRTYRAWGGALATAAALVTGTPASAHPVVRAGAPPCAASVADGSRVRVRRALDGRRHTGTAVGWTTATPRVLTARGDTVALRPEDRREVGAGRTGRRTLEGALVGFLAGMLTNLPCLPERTCGEQNPFPALGAGLGAVVGHQLRRERWAPVSADTACADDRP